MPITEGTQPVAVTWTGAWSSAQTTASFTPEAGSLLVALVCGSGIGGGAGVTASITDSLGGSWTLLKRENTVGVNTFGTAEVWCRDSPGSSLTVSATGDSRQAPGGQLTVRTLLGAKATASQNGATASKQNDSPATVQQSVTAGTGNLVYGSAFNWDTSTAMTVLGNTTAITAFVDATNGDNWAACKSSADTAGTATYGYSTSVRGKISLVEILAAPAAGGISSARPGKTWKRRFEHRQQLFAVTTAVSPDVSVNADNAAFTLLAQDAVAALGANADPVALTIAGQDAVAGLGANADPVAITLVAQDATAAVAVNAECATWALTGNDATAAIGANAENALWTLAGQDAVAALGANAGAVTVALAAQDATAAIGANAEFAPINLIANDATVQVSGSINAPAECATWSLAAQDATAGIGANADVALISWSTLDATVGVGANADPVALAFTALGITTQPPVVAYVEVIGTSTAGTVGAGSSSGVVEGSSSAGTVGAGSTSGAVEGATVPAGQAS